MKMTARVKRVLLWLETVSDFSKVLRRSRGQ